MNQPTWQLVTQEKMTNSVQGMNDPQQVDELTCTDCGAPIGWCSTGTFTDFYTDNTNTVCIDCHE